MRNFVKISVVEPRGVLYGVRTKQPWEIVLAFGYFTAMEFIQTLQWIWIDLCGEPMNEFLTILAYLHIAFQPFIINILMMHFVPQKTRDRVKPLVYALSAVATISLLMQLYPFSWAGECLPGNLLCGKPLCTVSGNWHLAWNIPLNGFFNGLPSLLTLPGYLLGCLALPFLYGAWKVNLYHIFFGPFLVWALIPDYNQAGATWCTISILLFILVIHEKPLRKLLYTRKWIL